MDLGLGLRLGHVGLVGSIVEDETLFEELREEGVRERDLVWVNPRFGGNLLQRYDEVHKFFVFVKEFGLLSFRLGTTPFQKCIYDFRDCDRV